MLLLGCVLSQLGTLCIPLPTLQRADMEEEGAVLMVKEHFLSSGVWVAWLIVVFDFLLSWRLSSVCLSTGLKCFVMNRGLLITFFSRWHSLSSRDSKLLCLIIFTLQFVVCMSLQISFFRIIMSAELSVGTLSVFPCDYS